MTRLGTPNVRYQTCYIKCPTGLYMLAGDMPAYFAPLLFETEEIAKQALAEAQIVLETRQMLAGSIFADAYINGTYRSGHVVVSA